MENITPDDMDKLRALHAEAVANVQRIRESIGASPADRQAALDAARENLATMAALLDAMKNGVSRQQ